MEYFKENSLHLILIQRIVIMGYIWISIPETRPLEDRVNIVITKNHEEELSELSYEDFHVASSLQMH